MARPEWAQEQGVHSSALSGRIYFLVFLTQGFSTLGWIPSPFQGDSKLTHHVPGGPLDKTVVLLHLRVVRDRRNVAHGPTSATID
jgi:hypothetical protein